MYIVHNIVHVHMTLDHVLGSGCPQLAWEMQYGFLLHTSPQL